MQLPLSGFLRQSRKICNCNRHPCLGTVELITHTENFPHILVIDLALFTGIPNRPCQHQHHSSLANNTRAWVTVALPYLVLMYTIM